MENQLYLSATQSTEKNTRRNGLYSTRESFKAIIVWRAGR